MVAGVLSSDMSLLGHIDARSTRIDRCRVYHPYKIHSNWTCNDDGGGLNIRNLTLITQANRICQHRISKRTKKHNNDKRLTNGRFYQRKKGKEKGNKYRSKRCEWCHRPVDFHSCTYCVDRTHEWYDLWHSALAVCLAVVVEYYDSNNNNCSLIAIEPFDASHHLSKLWLYAPELY